MTSNKKSDTDKGDARWLQIHFRLNRDENPALFDCLWHCQKGNCRTARLKLLAHEGMRSSQNQNGVPNGVQASGQPPSLREVSVIDAPEEAGTVDTEQCGLTIANNAAPDLATAFTAAEIFEAPTNNFQFDNQLR